MRRLTQTQPDNCWQTVVAMLLDVDPALLPDQHECFARREHSRYNNPLGAYLFKHHDLSLYEIEAAAFSVVRPKAGALHYMVGPTVRTPENGMHHVVAAMDGTMIHDPHPSRAGLTAVTTWGFLVPFYGDRQWSEKHKVCICPACAPTASAA